MTNLADPAFQLWLSALHAKGYDDDFIRCNVAVLRGVFESGREMQPCPPAPERVRDRYEEL